MLESRTGDSRNDVGVRPGGIVRQGDLEIGSLAGDMSLYLAAPPAEREVKKAGSELGLNSVGPGSSSSDGGGGHSSAVASIGWFDGFGFVGKSQRERVRRVGFVSSLCRLEQSKRREGQNGHFQVCLLCFGRLCSHK